ncbi:MAG: BamA/TamA family outer membrane protein [Deltaproteobacteria bacterium]|nr:BamA/TamA family outer membrane protein [Deltaproteobacteria bacterium]
MSLKLSCQRRLASRICHRLNWIPAFAGMTLWVVQAFAVGPNPIGNEGNFPPEVAPETKKEKFGFAGLPVVGYASGFGTGFGAVGSFYRKEPGITPYKYELDGQIYFMTSGMQSHRLRFDYLDVAGLPLRLRSMIGMLVLPKENYCGQGMRADCGIANANPNYYLTRYWEVFAMMDARWRLRDMPNKVEIIASWRGSNYEIGHFDDKGPYPGSLYATDFKNDPGTGFASVIEAGIMLDNRDFEPDPHEGYWVETTIRESSQFWGSKWNYIGANLSFRGYLPLDPAKRLTLAAQVIFDGMVGEVPLQEIVRVGGSGRYFNTFGGQEIGRGLREQYFPGRLKAYKQLELRYDTFGFKAWIWDIDLTLAAFADLGLVAWNYSTIKEEPFKPSIGFGGGLRLLWDKAVIVRFDVGVSPIEGYSPRFYFVIGNVF